MNLVKLSLTAFVTSISILFSGCSWCEVEVEKEKKIYIDREVEVLVDVPCNVPDVNCTAQGTDGEVIGGLLMCIVDLKRASEVCKHD